MSVMIDMLESWKNTEGSVHSNEELLCWIQELNQTTKVEIQECQIGDETFWFHDKKEGTIRNQKRSFFSIKGIQQYVNEELVGEQPIIIQAEIGYLGLICKKIKGVLHFLIQAKIEPGNVNCVQISPTIQATKSNFTRTHGGKAPRYLEYFEHASQYKVIYDQIQSEQASRFYKKRNRNIIIEVETEVEPHTNFRWMTLGQLKTFMRYDNLVNMDTRTVISGIPLVTVGGMQKELVKAKTLFASEELYHSIFSTAPAESIATIYQYINDYKMFENVRSNFVPLNKLVKWEINESGITCKEDADFQVRFFEIQIEGREVVKWTQPLFKAIGQATFGLITCDMQGVTKFLISARPEIGDFDYIELGPSVFKTAIDTTKNNSVEALFFESLEKNEGVLVDVVLSEEGGRFYHEQNRNVIIKVPEDAINTLPEGFFWVEYSTLNYLVQINNCLNIQLRNLLSMLEI